MEELFISKQKIFNRKKNVIAYELLFQNSLGDVLEISSTIKETSKLIISSISSLQLNRLLGKNILAFLTIDEYLVTKGIVDILDKKRFILNISDTIELNDEVVGKIIKYKKEGFILSIENFDSSAEMIIKFRKLFNHVDIIKVNLLTSCKENTLKLIHKFKGSQVKFLANEIETKEDYMEALELGFSYFQGSYLDKPEVMELEHIKEPNQLILMRLISMMKTDETTTVELEKFIKSQPDLSFKLIQFFNSNRSSDIEVKSLLQVLTLMGRVKLLKWLIVYIFSELSSKPVSKTVLELALKRAKRMESEAHSNYKEQAYIAGMFSMLDKIFDSNIKELMGQVHMDKDIENLVVNKKGIFAGSLMRAEQAEKEYLKKVMLENFEKLETVDLIYTLEDSGVLIDENKF